MLFIEATVYNTAILTSMLYEGVRRNLALEGGEQILSYLITFNRTKRLRKSKKVLLKVLRYCFVPHLHETSAE